MVYKIMQSKFSVFLEAFVVTAIIILIAIFIGMGIESKRNEVIIEKYKDYEIEALDLKLQNYYYQIMDQSSCSAAIEQNFQFADDLYLRGLEIEKYEEANQITEELAREKRRYVLLKTELWLNTILLKKKCDAQFDTVVYFYSGNPDSSALVAEQRVISNVLKSLKEEKGNRIVLLPIAADLTRVENEESLALGAVALQLKIYNVTTIPSILINEQTLLEGFHAEEEINKYLKYSNST